MPKMGDNALLKMVPFLQAMGERQPRLRRHRTPARAAGRARPPLDGDPAAALDALRERDPMLADARRADARRDARADAHLRLGEDQRHPVARDARASTAARRRGCEEDEVRARIQDVLGANGYELEFTEKVVGNSSPPDSPLMDALRGWVAREDPSARVVPTMLPAFTDSRTFRAAFPECVAYGFFPQRADDLYETSPLVHSRDERIATADLGFAARCYRDVTKELLDD